MQVNIYLFHFIYDEFFWETNRHCQLCESWWRK
jgi:hypothetical protein